MARTGSLAGWKLHTCVSQTSAARPQRRRILDSKLCLEPTLLCITETAAPLKGEAKQERRRCPRLECNGLAELQKASMSADSVEAVLKNLSERGCLVQSKTLFPSGSTMRVAIRVSSYELMLKGEVRHAHIERGIGIQFSEIRRGDRPLMQYLLKVLSGEAAKS